MYSRNEHIINQLHFNKNKFKKKENPHGSKVESAPKGVLPTQPPSSPVQSHPTVSPPHSNLFPLVINLVSFWFPLPIFLFAKKKKRWGGHLFAHKCTFSYFLLFLTLKEWGCRHSGAFVPHFFIWQHILEIAHWQVTGFFLHVFYSCSTVHSMYILYSSTLLWLGPQEGFNTLQW